MNHFKTMIILGCAVFFASCSQTVSAPKEDDSATESSSSKKGDKSSSSKEKISSSSFGSNRENSSFTSENRLITPSLCTACFSSSLMRALISVKDSL